MIFSKSFDFSKCRYRSILCVWNNSFLDEPYQSTIVTVRGSYFFWSNSVNRILTLLKVQGPRDKLMQVVWISDSETFHRWTFCFAAHSFWKKSNHCFSLSNFTTMFKSNFGPLGVILFTTYITALTITWEIISYDSTKHDLIIKQNYFHNKLWFSSWSLQIRAAERWCCTERSMFR